MKKWEWGIVGLILLTLIGVAWAIDESITVSYTSIGLTSGNYGSSRNAFITVEGNYIRFTLDGVTVPTSAGVGIRLEIGQNLTLTYANDLSKFRAVRGSATDATLKVTYY